jgi:hypothetical protein
MCAFPVTHTLLAEEWMALHGPCDAKERSELVVGTLFPDIRYIAEENRANTHIAHVTLEQIRAAQTPFESGKLLHCYVDDRRESWVIEWAVYDLLVDVPAAQRASFLKLVEDEILYCDAIRQHISSLFHFPPEEMAAGISKELLIKWHALLASYLRVAPSRQLTYLKRLHQGLFNLSPETIAEWATLLPEVAQRPEMGRYVERLMSAFREEFSSQP